MQSNWPLKSTKVPHPRGQGTTDGLFGGLAAAVIFLEEARFESSP